MYPKALGHGIESPSLLLRVQIKAAHTPIIKTGILDIGFIVAEENANVPFLPRSMNIANDPNKMNSCIQ
jgi:hypothetical protein